MKTSPSSEANRSSPVPVVPCIFWNFKFHYRIKSARNSVPFLSQIISVHATPSYVLKIHFNITLLSTPRFFKWSSSLRSHHQNSLCTSYVKHKCHMSRPSHSSRIEWYLVRNTSRKATSYAIFSTLLLRLPS
jgi:hypothetical protein